MSCRNQGKKTKDLLSKSSHNKKSVLYRDADISMLPTQVLLQKKKGKKTVISARERDKEYLQINTILALPGNHFSLSDAMVKEKLLCRGCFII